MSKLKPVILALSMMLVAPAMVQAEEITLIPAVKLQIGDRDNNGNYWDGGHWRDRDYWNDHYEWRDNRWHAHNKPPKPHHDNRDKHKYKDKHDGPGKGHH
ncbi:DUF2502 domain-containing protein [Pseudocitrobacter cyperus]|uniref:DUF2502 domain-containing protein n=1 Tax=Pseudocitrobacter cyperus TaxID=3112843 RepID=A0ABV0HIR7_9ENTR